MENRNFISGLVENLFWLLPLLIIFILLDYLYAIFFIITIGYIFYLLLDPLVCRLERIIRIRFLSVFIVISIFIAPIYFGFSSLAYLISNEYDNIYDLMTIKDEKGEDKITFKNVIDRIDDKIISITPMNYKKNVDDFFKDLQKRENINFIEWSSAIFNFQNTVYVFSLVLNILMYTIITFGCTFTLLMSAQKFKKSFIQLVPNRYFEMSLKIIDRISDQISSYVRGTLTAALIVGLLSFLGLEVLCSITGMKHDYIIIVGIIAGIFNLIPFIGPLIGCVAGIIFFLVSDHPPLYIEYYHILFIMLTFMAVQLFDNFVSYPLISSSTVGIHPMFVIIVVLIGGYILGPFGMIISVPIAATIKVIIEELMWGFKNYRYL